MIKPLLQDDALLADIESAKSDRPNFRLWWLGQSGFLVQFNGRHALVDPYLSDSLTVKYEQSDKPHVRMTERVIAPERLGFVDVVSSSHNHTDHFDPDTLKPLLVAKPALPLILPEANRGAGAFRIGLSLKAANLIGVRAGDVKSAGGFTFNGIPAAHNELEVDAEGNHKFLGYIFQFGPWRVYHAGTRSTSRAWRIGFAPSAWTWRCCPSTGTRRSARSRGISTGARRRNWRKPSARGW